MICDTKSNEMVGRIQSDLIPDNQIERVEWQENKVDIVYSHTQSETPMGSISAADDNIYYATNSISPSNPFKDYKGEIVKTAYGDVAFFDIITPKNDRYYQVSWDTDAFLILNEIDDENQIGGTFAYGYFNSYEEFKQQTLNSMSKYFSHEASLIERDDYPINHKLSRVNIVAAVLLDNTTFQLMMGASADLYTISRESINKKTGGDENVFSLSTNELFTQAATVGGNIVGEKIADEVLMAYKKGRQTMQFSVVANENKWYRVGDTVTPYGFNGQPISKKRTGEAKHFIVTSCEFEYKGSYRQNLTLIEI